MKDNGHNKGMKRALPMEKNPLRREPWAKIAIGTIGLWFLLGFGNAQSAAAEEIVRLPTSREICSKWLWKMDQEGQFLNTEQKASEKSGQEKDYYAHIFDISWLLKNTGIFHISMSKDYKVAMSKDHKAPILQSWEWPPKNNKRYRRDGLAVSCFDTNAWKRHYLVIRNDRTEPIKLTLRVRNRTEGWMHDLKDSWSAIIQPGQCAGYTSKFRPKTSIHIPGEIGIRPDGYQVDFALYMYPQKGDKTAKHTSVPESGLEELMDKIFGKKEPPSSFPCDAKDFHERTMNAETFNTETFVEN